jgi:hypothetical protein
MIPGLVAGDHFFAPDFAWHLPAPAAAAMPVAAGNSLS